MFWLLFWERLRGFNRYFSGIVGAMDFINSGVAELTKFAIMLEFYIFFYSFAPFTFVEEGNKGLFGWDPPNKLVVCKNAGGGAFGYFLPNDGKDDANIDYFLGFSTFASFFSSSFLTPKKAVLEIPPNNPAPLLLLA